MKRSTPNSIVYGETGFIPLKLDTSIQTRIVGYLAKLVSPASSIILVSVHHLFHKLAFLKNHKKNMAMSSFCNPKVVKNAAEILKIGSLIK